MEDDLSSYDQNDATGFIRLNGPGLKLPAADAKGEPHFTDFGLARPGIQAWWRLRSHWFSEEFAKFVNQVQQTAKPPRLYREANPDQ
jgi:hypothetical protein